MNHSDENKKKSFPYLKISLILLLIIVLLFAISYFLKSAKETVSDIPEKIIGEEGKVSSITEARLEDIVRSNEIYFASYTYNGISRKNVNARPVYYVSYEGSVKAGLDISQISISLDEENKTIIVRLPEITIGEPVVNAGTLQYIFVDDSYNVETVGQEAYKICLKDLSVKTAGNEKLLSTALTTAKITEKSLIEPLVNQVNKNEHYEVIVLAADEEYAPLSANDEAKEEENEE